MEGVDVAITASGRRSMLKLAQRMTANFCAGVCASTVHKWNKLNAGNVDEDVRVMTRKSVDDPGEPPGIVLSAATSVWLPVSPQRLFDFLRDERLRSEWDILSNGGPMQEMAHIAKGQDHGNCVSLLRASVISLPPPCLNNYLIIYISVAKFLFSLMFVDRQVKLSVMKRIFIA
jgi:homeobox-leucine zipper protein